MEAQKTIGAILVKTKSGSEATDLTISHLTKFGGLGISSDEIDVTDLDSEMKESIGGLQDAGDVAFEGFLKDEDVYTALVDLAVSQSVEAYTLTFSNGDKFAFSAWIKSMKDKDTTTSDARGFTGTFRITGKPVYTEHTVSA